MTQDEKTMVAQVLASIAWMIRSAARDEQSDFEMKLRNFIVRTIQDIEHAQNIL